MKKTKLLSLFSALSALLAVLCLTATLPCFYLSSIFRSKEHFDSLIAENLNIDEIRSYTEKAVSNCASRYSFPTEELIATAESIDYASLCAEYISMYTDAMLNAKEMPQISTDSDIFTAAIDSNYQNSLRREVFELAENRRLLSARLAETVTANVSALSVGLIFGTLQKAVPELVKLAWIKQLFPLFLALFVLFSGLSICFSRNRAKLLYFFSMALFAVPLIYAVPFEFLSLKALPRAFNLNPGATLTYITAIWDTLITAPSKLFIIATAVAAVLHIAACIFAIGFRRKSQEISTVSEMQSK